MAERIVLCDASPLIGLAAAGGFDLLRQLFGTVTITATVRQEVLAGKNLPGAAELSAAMRTGWVRVIEDPAETPDTGLDMGEATLLAAAARHEGPCLVLMDDLLGRQDVKALGLAVTGTAGVLLIAKRRGLVPAVRPLLDALARAHFRLSEEVIRAVLEGAGEA